MNDERAYAVRSSAHGSGYVPEHDPERFDLTLAEAQEQVRLWRLAADTVGGDAIIVRNPALSPLEIPSITDEEHLRDVMEHKRNVFHGCLRLSRYFVSSGVEGDKGLVLPILVNGYQHDLSKLKPGLEWAALRRGQKEKYPKTFNLAVKRHNHNPLNRHHPEAWDDIGGIHLMDRLHVAEMVADWKARSAEFGTSLEEYAKGPARKRFGFSEADPVCRWVDEFCTAICTEKFG